jgi:uncharacterized protein YkwD
VSRKRNIISLIALVATWTLVASAQASASDCGPVNTQVTGLSEAQMESSITCLINDERTSNGLQPVTSNGDLRDAALSHSNEMISQSYFEHTSPAGVTFMDRIEATGYMRGARTWTVGENLVWGTGPLSTPEALVTAWMNSPPHRENLLSGDFREVGMGVVFGTPSKDAPDGVTVTTDFGTRLADSAPDAGPAASGSGSGAPAGRRAASSRRKAALRRCTRRHGKARRRCVQAARRIR